jgi:hypothetical protein
VASQNPPRISDSCRVRGVVGVFRDNLCETCRPIGPTLQGEGGGGRACFSMDANAPMIARNAQVWKRWDQRAAAGGVV